MPKTTTITELERLLGKQKRRLKQLQSKRERLTTQIATIDKQIESLLGKPAKPAAPRKVRRRKRGTRGLERYVVDVLSKSAEPRTAAEIAKAVTEAGYKSNSKDFVSLVRQNCYRSRLIQTKERGKFALESPTTPPPRVVKKKKAAAK